MRFNIRCDMEGVTGVTSYEQVTLGNPRYEESRQALTRELLAVIEGIRSVAPGAEVVIFDEHMDGRNADVAQLPEGVAYVSGKPAYHNDNPGLIKGADAMLLVGFHSKAGTRGALLPHTYEHDILDLQVNGISLGEVGVEAAIAGEAGVPTIFYSGDDAGGEEIAQLIPGIVRVAVKRSLGETAALCLGGARKRAPGCGASPASRRYGCRPATSHRRLDRRSRRHPGPSWRAGRRTANECRRRCCKRWKATVGGG